MRKSFLTVLVAIGLTAFQSCRKEETNPASPASSSGQSSFRVRMTDAPGNFSGLFVEITSVDAYLENHGWVNLSNESHTISVLDLTNGAETVLALNTHAHAGLYTKLKITFGNENTLVLDGTSGSSEADLHFNSQSSKEVIIAINEQVSANASADVLLDFNVAGSILAMGNDYLIQPVIDEIEDPSTGISGDVQGTAQASVTLHNGQHSYNTFVSASGEFLIRGVDSGTYQLTVEGIHSGQLLPDEVTYDNVVIVDGQITGMGEIHF